MGLKTSPQVFNDALSPQQLYERINSKWVEIRNFCLLTTNINLEHYISTGGGG